MIPPGRPAPERPPANTTPAMHICLFDIDGTLISTGGAGKLAMERAFEEAFRVAPERTRVPYAGRTDRAIAGDLMRHAGIEPTAGNWQRFRAHYLEWLPRCLHDRPGQGLPGVEELLHRLRQPRCALPPIALGLLTGNTEVGAYAKLAHYGLSAAFEFGGFGDDHLDRDDVARLARAAVERRFADRWHPDRTWVIGDTPYDVRCGRAIGARTVAVATGQHSEDDLARASPDHLFADLSDAERFVRLLAEA